jgi:hypothetical protein
MRVRAWLRPSAGRADAQVFCRLLRQQLGDIRRDPPRLVFGEQFRRRSYRPILPLLLLLSPKAAHVGVRQWNGSSGKTSIAGYEISNWIIVLGAIIIVLLIFQNLH